jgi:hypothetical protein
MLYSLAVSALFVGCGGDSPTGPPPQPGELTVVLASGSSVGGVVLTVTGPGITSPAASGSAQLYYDQSGGALHAVVVGASLSGEILSFTVPDVAQVAGYQVSLQEATGTSNQPLSAGVQLSVVP